MGLREEVYSPGAYSAVCARADEVVRVLCAHHVQVVHGVRVRLRRQHGPLHWRRLDRGVNAEYQYGTRERKCLVGGVDSKGRKRRKTKSQTGMPCDLRRTLRNRRIGAWQKAI